jgi:phosphorylase superfamily protein
MSTLTTSARREHVLEDPKGEALARHIIDFDPDRPEDRLFAATAVEARAPLSPIPWPSGLAPQLVDSPAPPSPEHALPQADVLVVTWTVAEAKALADVLTPGKGSEEWQPYRHLFDSHYKPLIRPGAPALQSDRLGLYARCRIGQNRVLCMKSDLHLSQDGPHLPVRDLWKQIISESGAKLVITTGTAGGVGSEIVLGDVVVTKSVQFDCHRTFKKAPFAQASYTDAHARGAASAHFALADRSLIAANANRLPASARPPKILAAAHSKPETVLTTDFFAFDDTTDSYGLRAFSPNARAVEMGDAVLGLVCAEDIENPPAWAIVRNASDPQMDGSQELKQQAGEAAHIYEKYGFWTTVNSAIACWAVIAG